jgi:integrase
MDWSIQAVSRVISRIGREAKIVVSRGGKFASAHDLRRTFGLRWSERIPPKDLMVLMRHEDITTTMAYYVGQDADRTAEVIWRGDKFGTNPDLSPDDNSGDLTE